MSENTKEPFDAEASGKGGIDAKATDEDIHNSADGRIDAVPELGSQDIIIDEEEHETDRKEKKGRPFLIAIIALAVLIALSFIPWGDHTGNFLKDYNLLGDLMPDHNGGSAAESDDMLDPELEAYLDDSGDEQPAEPAAAVEPAGEIVPTELCDNPPLGKADSRDVPDCETRKDGIVVLEDYTPDGSGLKNLSNAIRRRGEEAVRIAVMGDSYIEGDIITMDLRDKFQEKYGGRGVGYLPAHSNVAGFRTTVKHSDSGWKHHPIKEASGTKYFTIAGEYYTGASGATVSLKGVSKNSRLSAWNTTRAMFVAPVSGTVTVTADGVSKTFDVTGGDKVQSVALPAETSTASIKSDIAGLIMLGVWAEDTDGVVVDNMSIRGDAGVSRKNTNVSLARQMREYVDYDLIIVEFGINALSAKQTDYTRYGNIMTDVLRRIRQCYPHADIILMGIGDRGQKVNGVPRSFPTAGYMVAAQRQAAKNAGVMFWDTREAMGGDDAVVRWREDKLVNGDYIHLNQAGGRRLAGDLFNAISASIK